MTPANLKMLVNEYDNIAKASRQMVQLEPPTGKNGRWALFIDGEFVTLMRPPKAMAFLDGWKLASAYAHLNDQPSQTTSESQVPPQNK